MAELKVKIPEELEHRVGVFPDVDWSKLMEEFIRVKTFELEFRRSKSLQRAMLEFLASKSKLTEEDVLELGRKINESAFKRLEEKGVV